MSGWQPMATAPRDGTRFDVWIPCNGGYRITNLWFRNDGKLYGGDPWPVPLAAWPTHWCAILAAPSSPASDAPGIAA